MGNIKWHLFLERISHKTVYALSKISTRLSDVRQGHSTGNSNAVEPATSRHETVSNRGDGNRTASGQIA